MDLTDEQFDEFVASLPELRRAETAEDRAAVFAFRYQVLAQELGHKFGDFDHVCRHMRDAEDDKPSSTLYYTADDKGITGSARIRHWEPGEVPAKVFKTYSMERFPGIARLRVGEIGRVVVRPDHRGGLTPVALFYAIPDVGKPHAHLDLLFADCLPGLVRRYEQLGCRRYAGRMIPTPDGLMVPMVAVVANVDWVRATGSILAPKVERNGREPLDTAPFAELFDERNVPVQFDKKLVRAAIDDGVAASVGFLSQISTETVRALADKGFIIEVTAGTLLTEAGLSQRELFVIIDGEFEAFNGERTVRRVCGGEVVDEMAFFTSEGRRISSVRCIRDGRALVLRRRVVDELRVSAPAAAADILFHLARTLADRWSQGLGCLAGNGGTASYA
jgi:hypothetical protein